jgi:hypothetical protein
MLQTMALAFRAEEQEKVITFDEARGRYYARMSAGTCEVILI